MQNRVRTPRPFVVSHRHAQTAMGALRYASDRFLMLPLGAALAMVWANVGAESYFTFAQRFGFAVNEIGMAFFFALMAQEIVEAVMPGGALHTWRRWGLALIGAAGGIAGAGATYIGWVLFREEVLLVQAWPIACSVDIAVAYYCVRTVVRRASVLPFVLLLAIATDVFGMIVVAFNQAYVVRPPIASVLVATAIAVAAFIRARRVRMFWPYIAICGTASWWAMYWASADPGPLP